MGRIVIVDTDWQSLAVPGSGAAAQDLLEVKLAATQFAFLHGAYIMQHSEEPATDAEEIKVAIKRASGGYTSGHFGSAATVTKGATGDATNGLSVAIRNNTTQAVAGAGTLETIMPGVFNVLSGEWERIYIPELRPPIAPSEGIILAVEEAFADTVILRGVLIIELFG